MRHNSWIWDLDGTLFDSYGVIVGAIAQICREDGHPEPEDRILKICKDGSVTVWFRQYTALFGGSPEEYFLRYRKVSHGMDSRITLIPGAAETLQTLADAGDQHFVYTHRGASTHEILDRLGLTGFFREVVTSDAGFTPKPSGEGVKYLMKRWDLDPGSSWYIGDRQLDVLCGKDAGIKSVLYLPEGATVTPTGREDLIIRDLTELTAAGGRKPSWKS